MSRHDSFCPWPETGDAAHCDPCGLIARVRVDEQAKAVQQQNVAALADGMGYEQGYRDGMLRAATVVTDYAEDTHPKHSGAVACQRCDITAALRTAALHVTKAVS